MSDDLISRQAGIDSAKEGLCDFFGLHADDIKFPITNTDYLVFALNKNITSRISSLPSAERKKGNWTTEQVAEMLANLFGDECACNCINIDEWLPSACKYADTQCPEPKEKHGCWMQFLIQGGGETDDNN